MSYGQDVAQQLTAVRSIVSPRLQRELIRRSDAETADGPRGDEVRLDAEVLYRLVMGLDAQPVVMPAEDMELLNDPLAAGLLYRGKFPRTVDELLSDLDAAVCCRCRTPT